MQNYRLTRDFYLVFVDEIWESKKSKSGLITSVTANANNGAPLQALEELEDRGEYKRRYGTVLQLPASFSNADLEMVDPGLPSPRRYVGHDWLQNMRNIEQRGYRNHEPAHRKYYPSTFDRYDTVTMSDYAKRVNVQVGDKVYFDHKSTDVERYMGRYKDGHIFSIAVNEIVCGVRQEKIFKGYSGYKSSVIYPQGTWVFVKLNMETWEDITLPGTNIVVKCAPEALPLQGRVVAAQKKELEGKNILFERDADAPITVEGKEMTCMEERDILAVIKP